MSTNTETTVVDEIRDTIARDWYVEANGRRDGFILAPGRNGVVAVTVGSVGRVRPAVRPEQVTADSAWNVRGGFMSDRERRSTLVGIGVALAAAGWDVTRLGDVVVVNGRA
jgi:hypothetical protein